MRYGEELKKLLQPLGIYDLGGASGAELEALFPTWEALEDGAASWLELERSGGEAICRSGRW